MSKYIVGIIGVLLLLSVSFAEYPNDTIWVSDSLGDDANDGSQVNPKATIQAGINALTTGGVVIIDNRNGNVYDETITQASSNVQYCRLLDWWYADSGYVQVHKTTGYAININNGTAQMIMKHLTITSDDNYAVYYIYGLYTFEACSIYTDASGYDGIYYITNGRTKFVDTYIRGNRHVCYYNWGATFKDCELEASTNGIAAGEYTTQYYHCTITVPTNQWANVNGYPALHKNCTISGGYYGYQNGTEFTIGCDLSLNYGINAGSGTHYYYADLFRSAVWNSNMQKNFVVFYNTTFLSGLPINLNYNNRVIFVNCIFVGNYAVHFTNSASFVRFYNCDFDPSYGATADAQNDVWDWDTINCISRNPQLDPIEYFPLDTIVQKHGVPFVYVEDMDSLLLIAPTTDINDECLAVNDSEWTLGAKSWTHSTDCPSGIVGTIPDMATYDRLISKMEEYFNEKGYKPRRGCGCR